MGPCATVIFPAELAPPHLAAIDALLDRIGVRPEDENIRSILDVWITDTLPMGGTYSGEGRPFSITPRGLNPPGGEIDLQDHEIQQIRAGFDFDPEFVIGIGANCNQPADHQVLAELCHYLASVFGGVIGFNGALLPPDIASWEVEWPDVESRFLEWVSGLPRKIISIPYTTVSGSTWVCHYCTPDFLEAWMNHPEFHMVK